MHDPANVTAALRDHVNPLTTADPDATTDRSDLAPIVEAVADASIIGLGEATHGTREFFQLKDRIVRYLVEEHGLRLFGLESNFAETMALDRYITQGEGTALDALEDIYFWTWDTEEVVAMIEWLREFNDGRPHDDQVRFWGYDMQYTTGAAAALQDYLGDVDSSALDEHDDTLQLLQDRELRHDTDGDYEDRLDRTRRLIDDLRTTLENQKLEYVDASTYGEYDLARQLLRTIEQALTSMRAAHVDDDNESVQIRDRAMAENVSWILEHSAHDRIALWAHNEHVRRGTMTGDWGEARTMGDFLGEKYGDEYYALGFDFAAGRLQAIVEREGGDTGLEECTFSDPTTDSLTATLARVEEPLFFLGIDDCTTSTALFDLFQQERTIRSAGAMFYGADADEHWTTITPADAYDGLIFVQETTRAIPNERE